MEENTLFLRALLRHDWETYGKVMGSLAAQGKGTPVAIIGSTFQLAVPRCFGEGTTVADVVQFVADARIFYGDTVDLPQREAEAIMRAVLDLEAPWVEEVVENLPVVEIASIEARLLAKLLADRGLSDTELDSLLEEAERSLREDA